jgi:hypothetical protein
VGSEVALGASTCPTIVIRSRLIVSGGGLTSSAARGGGKGRDSSTEYGFEGATLSNALSALATRNAVPAKAPPATKHTTATAGLAAMCDQDRLVVDMGLTSKISACILRANVT